MKVRIPYGRQTIDDSDVAAVAEVLRSDWLTQGPKVEEFERALASYCKARFAVVFSNGTAALQAAYAAAGLGKGQEVVTTPLTFAATANAALWLGARPVFADVEAATGNPDPAAFARAITAKTRVLAPVDYSGRPIDHDAFRELARRRGLVLVEDACHALGALSRGRKVGSLADMTVFSFHPVKSITTGEGGAVLTGDERTRDALARYRTHGIVRGEDWEYSVEELAPNSRLTDVQCALGLSQLRRVESFLSRRRELAARYGRLLAGMASVEPPPESAESAWHLYVIRLRGELSGRRRDVFRALRARGIGTQVHYIPVYWHPLYRRLGHGKGECPRAEAFYGSALSLPIYPSLTDAEQDEVVAALRAAAGEAGRAPRLRAPSGQRRR